jgi:tRNA(fMet)-specific endonuclease VapC
MQYLLDTNHASAVFGYKLDLASHPKRTPSHQFGLPLPVIAELWFMVFASARLQKNQHRLLEIMPDFTRWPFDENAAVEFGRIKADLKKAGTPIPTADVQIAAIARANGLTLLTSDKHFNGIRTLNVENWL